MAKILIVDDDRRIRELLKGFLAEHQFAVTTADSADSAERALAGEKPALMILDVMMPGLDGISFLKKIRAAGESFPVLMLSALGEPKDKISGLQAGSDDYLAKPFDPLELLLRVQKILKRPLSDVMQAQSAEFGPFIFNIETLVLKKHGKVIKLSEREAAILRKLALRVGTVVDRFELSQDADYQSARNLDVHITRLRQKLEKRAAVPEYIITKRGEGYMLAGKAHYGDDADQGLA